MPVRHWRQWRVIGADPWVVSVLRDGYRIPFEDHPPPLREVPGTVPNVPAELRVLSRPPTGDRDHADQRGPRDRPRARPQILQLPIPHRKLVRWLATSDRPLAPEPVRTPDTVQDGNTLIGTTRGQKRGLPSLNRPQGCILPDPRSSLLQEAPLIRVKRDGLPVQGPVLRAFDRATGIRESFRSSLSLGPLSWGPPTAIPGRLADPGVLGDQDQTTRKPTSFALPLPRDKRTEVRPLPVQVRRIPWHDHRHDLRPSLANRSSDAKIPHCSKEFLVTVKPPSTTVAGGVGTHVVIGEVDSPGMTPDALTPVASEVQLVHRE